MGYAVLKKLVSFCWPQVENLKKSGSLGENLFSKASPWPAFRWTTCYLPQSRDRVIRKIDFSQMAGAGGGRE